MQASHLYDLSPGSGLPLLLLLTGTNEEQRAQERQETENSIETCILSRVKQINSPGWMHETRAGTWYTGKTQRERVEREVGEGLEMGNTCKPMAISFQCMTKSTTIKKKKFPDNLMLF